MTGYSETITFNAITLTVTSMTPTKRQKTRKEIIGKSLIQTSIVGMSSQQWELEIEGLVTGTTVANLSTNRGNIEGFEDATAHAFVDGIHDGTFYLVPGSLTFKDSNDRGNKSYVYSFRIIEE